MLLAIDLSRHAGWCCGSGTDRPLLGIWELPSAARQGEQFSALCDVLADAITVHRPSLVLLEADINLHRQNEAATAYQQLGMLAICELVCWKRDVECKSASAGQARQTILGRQRWSQKGQAKEAVLAYAADCGHPVLDHNIADAYLLWRYGIKKFSYAKRRIAA